MDKLTLYRQHIQSILTHHCQLDPVGEGMETYTVFDMQGDHYQVISVGWENGFRMYGCLIHVDIKDGKIWIQYDGTEYSVANELIDRGVPKQDIVLAYHAPYARKYTEFALG
ncbi:XisI protein [Pseudanabaena sp. Chao 1811]|uniref:XisI protein n=1 Tax=Pseudanabaena sp. Chao 1811 TaxID=2963092 RepID=UPI0022F3AF21|nr:XisI protein [Pseudanabaena sp. Chao 1811]